jgi:hypothetical protein
LNKSVQDPVLNRTELYGIPNSRSRQADGAPGMSLANAFVHSVGRQGDEEGGSNWEMVEGRQGLEDGGGATAAEWKYRSDLFALRSPRLFEIEDR